MRQLMICFAAIFASLPLIAQDKAEQVLVFRSTGEVNLFYSDRIDSVTCSCLDADSVLHEEPVSQIFWSQDTVMMVPLAEIDSVAFGERNVMEFREDVREISVTDFPWILRTEGACIYYRADTPQDILPASGQKLFCGFDGNEGQKRLFPGGLTARVVSVQSSAAEICVTVERVELDEVFSRLFFAGEVSEERPLSATVRRRAPVNVDINLQTPLSLGELGEITVDGKVGIHGQVVVSLFTHYYHANLNLDYGFGFGVSIQSEISKNVNYEDIWGRRTIGTFYRVLNLDASFGAFADLSAEMKLELEMERMYHRHLLWTQIDGENTFELRNASGREPVEDRASVDLTLDGSVHFGPLLQLDFGIVGNVVGARAKLKIGPEIEGKVSLGMLRQMHEYNPQLYGEATLSACAMTTLEGFLTNRHYLMWGDVDEHPIFKNTLRLEPMEIELFPQYVGTRGTQRTTSQVAEVSVATKVDGEIVHEVETGFELVDEQTQEIVDSVFVGLIPADDAEVKGISTDFEVPARADRSLIVRPVFHYAGYTVSAAPAQVQKGVQIQPVIFSGSNGAVAYASSYPFTGEVTGNGTNYRAGAYLPIPVRDTVFQKEPKIIDTGTYIRGGHEEELIGTWTGQAGEQNIVLVFKEDGSGTLNDDVFTYELNMPQSGQIMLSFENGNRTSVLTILRLREGILQYRIDKDKTIYTLTKLD